MILPDYHEESRRRSDFADAVVGWVAVLIAVCVLWWQL